MKVLVAVDDTAHADVVATFVERMGWPPDSEFLVLSAARPATAHTLVDAAGFAFLKTVEKETATAHRQLVERIEARLSRAGYRTRGLVPSNDPRDAIVETAAEERVDLVVVGSHGHRGFDRLLMGSVASHVVSHAPSSVLVVKLPREERRAP